jgi:hypothetical protein
MVATPHPQISSPATPPVSPQPHPQTRPLVIRWEKPPADFQLDDTPVENTGQPLLAGALRESLEIAGRIQPGNLIASNFGLCAKVNGELVIKAPDWVYVTRAQPLESDRKTYTPHLEGEVPTIVLEFLSETDGGEYSLRMIPPLGKWHFYESVLKVPTYGILEPEGGLLEIYRLQEGRYVLEIPDENGRHWFDELQLFLGTWRGEKEGRSGYWLRWWDGQGNLLPWAIEQMEMERQRTETERQRAEAESQRAEAESQRAEAESQRAERLAELLRSQGIDPDAI